MNIYGIGILLVIFTAWSFGMYEFGAHNQLLTDQVKEDKTEIQAAGKTVVLTQEVMGVERDLSAAVSDTEKSDAERHDKVVEAHYKLIAADADSAARNRVRESEHRASGDGTKSRTTSASGHDEKGANSCYVSGASVADIIRAATP